MSTTLTQLQSWVSNQLNTSVKLETIQGDASFRHYYRVSHQGQTFIAVFAPPDKENNEAFVTISQILASRQVPVPKVLGYDATQGFMLLSDLGKTLLLDVLNPQNVHEWYTQSLDLLLKVQQGPQEHLMVLPPFEEAHIKKELGYFQEWFLGHALKLTLSKDDLATLSDLYDQLVEICLVQPQVMIHRDFHSRNLMINAKGDLGLIDYQDAMIGPVTYDFVSLVKDCYVRWPEDKVQTWGQIFHQQLRAHQLIEDLPLEMFYQWVDWTGLQRHLKVLGIFSRLKLRDQKQGYLKDTPRVMAYVLEVLARYPEFKEVESFFQQKIMPPLLALWHKEGIQQVA